jgi:tellurite resistance protein TehA-like permease
MGDPTCTNMQYLNMCVYILLYFVAVFILISIAVFVDKAEKQFSTLDFNYNFALAFSVMGMLAANGCGVALLVGIMKQEHWKHDFERL